MNDQGSATNPVADTSTAGADPLASVPAPHFPSSGGLLVVESLADESDFATEDDGDSDDRERSSNASIALSGKNTLTKAELAALMFEQVGLNKREAKDMVEAFFDEIRGALARGEMVKLSGFGNFQLREKPQRPGRNPKTGEEIPISARRVVTFHASQKLKDEVEEKLGDSVQQFTLEHQQRAGQAPSKPIGRAAKASKLSGAE
jgi:integration host factor subunit alpha